MKSVKSTDSTGIFLHFEHLARAAGLSTRRLPAANQGIAGLLLTRGPGSPDQAGPPGGLDQDRFSCQVTVEERAELFSRSPKDKPSK